MAILFAAPFILAAGVVFTVLSLIPRTRRLALPIPAGILCSGPFSWFGIFLVLSATPSFEPEPTRHSLAAFFGAAAVTAVVGGFFTWVLARFVASILPAALLRVAVFLAGLSSYFVLIAGSLLFVQTRGAGSPGEGWAIIVLTLSLELLLSFIGAWFVAQRSEEFRPARFRLPRGTSFRDRAKNSDETASPIETLRRAGIEEPAPDQSLERMREILSRVPEVPPIPGDEFKA